MASKLSPESFRSVFRSIDKDVLRWFPGHMGKGLKQMQHKLRSVDCIIEVHDARIPLSGRNGDFKYTLSGIKPHILVLNKVDLIDSAMKKPIINKLKSDCNNIVFTHCRNHQCEGIQSLFPLAQSLIHNSDRYNRTGEEDYNVMVIGIPNVGKSSVINALRNRFLKKSKASAVGAAPGITRSVLNKIKMCEKPLFYLFDTPGILTPNIPDIEIGLKLAACNTIQDHLVGERVIADYILYWLNKHEHFEYIKHFKMEKPSDNILEVLTHISKVQGRTLKVKDVSSNSWVLRPDFDKAAQDFITSFRIGNFGKLILDEDLLQYNKTK